MSGNPSRAYPLLGTNYEAQPNKMVKPSAPELITLPLRKRANLSGTDRLASGALAPADVKKHFVSGPVRQSLEVHRSYEPDLRVPSSLSRIWAITTWTRPMVKHVREDAWRYSHLSLMESLYGLERIRDEARVEELPIPSPSTIDNARLLLPKLHRIHPGFYDVYPTEEGAVAITPPAKKGASASIECHDNNIVYCFASIYGNSRRAKFYQMDDLPDPFIEKVLRDLGR